MWMVWSARARTEGSLSSSKVCRAVTNRNRAEMSPRACRDPQASPPDHAPYSPLQISQSISLLWSLEGRLLRLEKRAARQALGKKLCQTPCSPARSQQRSPRPCHLGCIASPHPGDPPEEQKPRGGLSKVPPSPPAWAGGQREAQALHRAAGAPAAPGLLLAASAAVGAGARLPRDGLGAVAHRLT